MLTLIILYSIGSGNVWADTYTITFTTGTGDGTKASTSTAASTCTTAATYVTGDLATASNTYYSGESGLKLGTSSGAGDIKFNLSTDGQVVPTKVSVYAKYYSSKKIKNVQVCTNLGSNTATTTTGSFAEYSYSYSGSSKLTYIEIKSTGYIWVQKVVVTYSAAAPKYTLKVSDGLGGYTTYSNKVKSDLTESTAMGGHECSGDLQGAYSGWRTSALETPAGSPGTTYSHSTAGAMPASGSTLYAVYYSYGEGGYLTNTLCEETCSNIVTPAAGTKTNVTTIAFDKASVETCSETASDRQVTVTITPASCYAVPSSTRLTVTGTSASYVSGPTDNGNGTYSFVYQFAQNATSTSTFAASLGTKTTYTINYNKGTYGTGENSSDTKTCGVNLTLPSSAMFTRDGYTQTGWSTAAAGNTKNYNLGASYTTDAGTTLYPNWEANKYTVTWSVNGSTYTTTANVSYNTTTATPANPSVPGECTGSTFMGWTSNSSWASDSAPGDLFNGTSPTITGNITFYAVFADEE